MYRDFQKWASVRPKPGTHDVLCSGSNLPKFDEPAPRTVPIAPRVDKQTDAMVADSSPVTDTPARPRKRHPFDARVAEPPTQRSHRETIASRCGCLSTCNWSGARCNNLDRSDSNAGDFSLREPAKIARPLSAPRRAACDPSVTSPRSSSAIGIDSEICTETHCFTRRDHRAAWRLFAVNRRTQLHRDWDGFALSSRRQQTRLATGGIPSLPPRRTWGRHLRDSPLRALPKTTRCGREILALSTFGSRDRWQPRRGTTRDELAALWSFAVSCVTSYFNAALSLRFENRADHSVHAFGYVCTAR